MQTAIWIVCGVVALFLGGRAISRFNQRNCMHAFGEGFMDASRLNRTQLEQKFSSYLKPIRPMDAAAYVHGLECAILGVKSPDELKATFLTAYKGGEITRCGTEMRRMDAKTAVSFLWAGSKAIWHYEAIKKHPEMPVLAAIAWARLQTNNDTA